MPIFQEHREGFPVEAFCFVRCFKLIQRSQSACEVNTLLWDSILPGGVIAYFHCKISHGGADLRFRIRTSAALPLCLSCCAQGTLSSVNSLSLAPGTHPWSISRMPWSLCFINIGHWCPTFGGHSCTSVTKFYMIPFCNIKNFTTLCCTSWYVIVESFMFL